MIIGNNNVFEVDCVVESRRIGDNNIVESKARVGRPTVLTNGCVIGAKCQVSSPSNLLLNFLANFLRLSNGFPVPSSPSSLE